MKKRRISTTALLVITLLVGLSVMLYPTVSDWWNRRVQTRAVSNYAADVANMDNSEKERMLSEAVDYNRRLFGLSDPFYNNDELPQYNDVLNVSGTGVMGYITIPKIHIEMPIYHGTDEGVLNIAGGHLRGSSLPVGGKNTHAVISAHRGLPSAKLFTDLDEMIEGDTFTITILDEVLTYEVEKIFIVLPEEMDKLAIIPGGDYVTLLTCTPYGVNTHRLLVRGRRIDTVLPHNVKVSTDALQLDSVSLVPYFAATMLVVLLIKWIAENKFSALRSERKKIINAARKEFTYASDDDTDE